MVQEGFPFRPLRTGLKVYKLKNNNTSRIILSTYQKNHEKKHKKSSNSGLSFARILTISN
jgi:hypothetical protein